MSKIKNTRFEVFVSNSKRNDNQNVTGKFGSFSGSDFTPDDCAAGFLCVTKERLPLLGYEDAGLKNANSYYMIAATNGNVAGLPADRTGIYACNTYDVNKAVDSDGMVVNLPGKTLGLALPADERGDFTELMVGEQYNFGAGNFSTAPSESLKYATITNGLLVAVAAAPTDGSIYFAIEDFSKRFIEGAYDGGQKITVRCLRSVKAAG